LKQQGHEPRLIAPSYVRPFVKRHKNYRADAEVIVEAALRPTMRFVEVKDEAAQARCMLFRVRDQLVRQCSQTVNALRAFLAELGQVAPVGMQNVSHLAAIVADAPTPLPSLARELCEEMLNRIDAFSEHLVHLNRRINEVAAQTPDVARLRTIPCVGPVTARAIRSFAPPLERFRSGRDFAVWRGLAPRQHSTAGKERLGRVSKMGQNDT
jgi:transposase